MSCGLGGGAGGRRVRAGRGRTLRPSACSPSTPLAGAPRAWFPSPSSLHVPVQGDHRLRSKERPGPPAFGLLPLLPLVGAPRAWFPSSSCLRIRSRVVTGSGPRSGRALRPSAFPTRSPPRGGASCMVSSPPHPCVSGPGRHRPGPRSGRTLRPAAFPTRSPRGGASCMVSSSSSLRIRSRVVTGSGPKSGRALRPSACSTCSRLAGTPRAWFPPPPPPARPLPPDPRRRTRPHLARGSVGARPSPPLPSSAGWVAPRDRLPVPWHGRRSGGWGESAFPAAASRSLTGGADPGLAWLRHRASGAGSPGGTCPRDVGRAPPRRALCRA